MIDKHTQTSGYNTYLHFRDADRLDPICVPVTIDSRRTPDACIDMVQPFSLSA